MPGQINKALAEPSGQLSIRCFFPLPQKETEGKRRGGGWGGRKVGVEKEREEGKKPRETSLISIPQPWTKR